MFACIIIYRISIEIFTILHLILINYNEMSERETECITLYNLISASYF